MTPHCQEKSDAIWMMKEQYADAGTGVMASTIPIEDAKNAFFKSIKLLIRIALMILKHLICTKLTQEISGHYLEIQILNKNNPSS